MKADFAAVRRRLDGADQDFRALGVEMNAAIKAYGDAVKTLPKAHKTKRNVVVAVVVDVMPIPLHWDRRIAHVLYDTRSALDHLVHELYVASTGKRPTNEVAAVLQFPICDKKGAWMSATADTPKHISRLHGLNREFVKIIHRHQPYRSRKTALKRLRQFNDLDKHRRPNVVLFAVKHAYIWAEPLVSCRVIGEVELRPGLLRPLKVGAELAYVYIDPIGPADQPCVGVGFNGSAYPAFSRGVAVDDLMFKTILETRSIIEACAKIA